MGRKIKKGSLMLVISLGMALLLFAGCETWYRANGHVYSARTEVPLENVLVRLKHINSNESLDVEYTDYEGAFELYSRIYGCPFGCRKKSRDIEVEFIRNDSILLKLNLIELGELRASGDSLVVRLND